MRGMKFSHLTFSILFLAWFAPGSLSAADAIAPYAYELTRVFGLPITNSMATGWVISLVLILAVRLAIGRPKLVPGRGQAIIESLISGLRDMLEPIVGKKAMVGVFPFLLAIFVFILIHNWSGLLPGVGAFGHHTEEGVFHYWVRPGNADLNMTLGLALVAQFAWLFYCFKYAGARHFAYEIFGNKADRKETPFLIWLGLIPVFLAVGLIELVSILFRSVSLSFRLFGNIFGGENLLDSMGNLFAYLLPIPFYFFEVLVGVVQAFIFTILVAIYIGLVCNHGEDDEAHGH